MPADEINTCRKFLDHKFDTIATFEGDIALKVIKHINFMNPRVTNKYFTFKTNKPDNATLLFDNLQPVIADRVDIINKVCPFLF